MSTQTKSKPVVEEPKDEAAGSANARKMAVSLLTRLTNLDRRLKGIARSVTGDEALPRDVETPPRSLNDILAEALRVSERATRTTSHLADRLGVE